MKRTLSRVITVVVMLAMMISLLAAPASALTWDNVSETRYASRYQTSDYATGKFYKNMTQIPLTGDGRRDVVAVAASQVGYIEGDSAYGYDGETGGSTNYTEYGYFMGLSGGSGHAWCAAFCAWTFYTAEVTDVDGYYYDTNSGNIWADTYVPDWSTYLINQGRYKTAYGFRNHSKYGYLYDASYVPQPGDLVFFNTSSEDYPTWEGHIGLVAYSDGTYVYTLEGNTSSQDGVESEGGGMFFKKYSLTGSSLVGFGVMPYNSVAGLPEIDYTGANPTPGLYVTTSGAKSVYQNINDSTASWTLPMSSVFEVSEIKTNSSGTVMLRAKCEINGTTVYGWIAHGSDTNGYTKTLQIYAAGELEIPEEYGPSQDAQGNYKFENAYGYVFDIDDVNGTIEGEDATLITSASAYSSCNPNWAISVQLRPNGNDGEYSVVKVVPTPGSADKAGIELASGDKILVVHSADSKPGYANWMDKVAAMALKEGDVLSINSGNTSATVLSAGEPIDPPVTEPTEPEENEPSVDPDIEVPDYGGLIPGAGQQGYTSNLCYGVDNVNDESYRQYITNDDSGADYSLLDFAAMKASGCDYVIIRIGSQDTTGCFYDPHFITMYNMAREAGMDVGAYFYSHALTYDEAVEEAEFCIDLIEDHGMYFEYPVYIDIEESDQLALSQTKLDAIAYGWCDTMVDAGYFPGIYTGYNASLGMGAQLKQDYDMWIAWYSGTPDNTNHSDFCSMWQYTSTGTGGFAGIGKDDIDLNVCYKDYPAIIAAGGYNNTNDAGSDPDIGGGDDDEIPDIGGGDDDTNPDKDGDGIPDSYGVTVEDGIYSFENAYGFVFDIDDVNGTIGGEDATLITTDSAYSSCNPNWAVSIVLRETENSGEYQVVKTVYAPGSAANAGIDLEDGEVVLVVHSAASYPNDKYDNWMSKVAALALKEGDIIEIASDNSTATVIGPGELPGEPDVTDPTDPDETEPTEPEETEPTEPEETEPDVTEPEETVPDFVLPGPEMPEYGGIIPGAGIPGTTNNKAPNLYYGCDVSFYNVNDTSYANYTTSDDSKADYTLLDFEKMKADGCDFVILRMGSQMSKGAGARYYDPHFVTLYNMARAADMDIGLYFYSYAMNESQAIADAQYVIDVIEDYGMHFEYPIYIDIEESDQLALPQATLDSVCYGWCETLYDAGYYPGIYGNYNLYDAVSSDIQNDYDFWVAWVSSADSMSVYNPSTHNISNEASMWQYSFYGYEYDGVGMDMLDVNVSYKDYPTIMAAGGYNNIPKDEGIRIPGSYYPAVDEEGKFSFGNAYGYVFDIDDVNGIIEGGDITLINSSSAYNSCNPNWAISVQLRPTEDGKYEVVKVVATPGSAANAGITMEDGDLVLVVHSNSSQPGYDNWMSKVAAMALKEGDIIDISADQKTATVEKPQKPATDITATAKGDVAYEVEGQVVTVNHSTACKVGYWDETSGTYKALDATLNADGSYSFTAPEGVTEVLVVVKGDANNDGSVAIADATRARAYYNSKVNLSAAELFAADVNGDGSVNMADATSIRAVYNSKKELTW